MILTTKILGFGLMALGFLVALIVVPSIPPVEPVPQIAGAVIFAVGIGLTALAYYQDKRRRGK